MGGSHREAVEVVALRREPERRRGLRWLEPATWTHRQWRRGEELELGRDREENSEKRERAAGGHFSSASVARGSEGKRRGACGHDHMAEGEGGEVAPGTAVGSTGRPATPPAVGRGRRRCRATGESGRAQLTRCKRA
jgi:hypothetical protein